jgi:hypothetical protein
MKNDVTYVILVTEREEVAGYIRSSQVPSMDDMIDHLTILAKYDDRYDFIAANLGMIVGAATLH